MFIFGNNVVAERVTLKISHFTSSYTHMLTGRFAISKVICTCSVQLSTAVSKHELSELIYCNETSELENWKWPLNQFLLSCM